MVGFPLKLSDCYWINVFVCCDAVDGSSTGTRVPRSGCHFEAPTIRSISTIGLDIAKSVFQVHGVDAAGQVVVRRQLRRRHVLGFSRSCRHAWWGSKLAHHRTIGPVNCRRWDIRCD